jgi:hypothetical protein
LLQIFQKANHWQNEEGIQSLLSKNSSPLKVLSSEIDMAEIGVIWQFFIKG